MQKCGTGALKEFLKRNPFIGYSLFGESHFFDRTTNYQQGYEYYLSLQPEVQPEVMVFDKTPSDGLSLLVGERIMAHFGYMHLLSAHFKYDKRLIYQSR